MAEIKVMKIDTDGVLIEHTGSADDLTMNQYTVDGGLVASATGINMNDTAISAASDLSFNDPTTDGITRTAGTVAADDLMVIDEQNTMTTAGGIAFPAISDAAGEVDAFKLPAISGAPTATPTVGGEGHMLWDSTGDSLYAWNGSSWQNLSIASESQRICVEYTNANAGAMAIGDAVYISAANSVDLADVSGGRAASRVVGIVSEPISAAATGKICSDGVVTGLTGLTAGARYYADPAGAGDITTTVPTGSGNSIVQIGYAKSTTEMHLQIAQLGRRS